MAKVHLDQQNQRPASADDENLTPISTKEVENKDEILLQLFDSTKKVILNLLVNLQCYHKEGTNTYWCPSNMIQTTS